MKSLITIMMVFCVGGCAVNKTVSTSEVISIREAVKIAFTRASEHAELGGEKDEYAIEIIGLAIADKEDHMIVKALRNLDDRSVSALRVFFKPNDFKGRSRLTGEKPKPETFNYLNDLPIPPRWPIEAATSSAWDEVGLRLDWKADHR